MSKSRREFLTQSTLTLLRSAAAPAPPQPPPTPPPPGAPPAFGTAPAVGPEVTPATFVEAEKLVQFPLTEKDRAQAAGNWRQAMAPLYERRTGPRKVVIADTTAPYSRWDCTLPGMNPGPAKNEFIRTKFDSPLPATDEAIAFAPVHHLSRWIETRKLTSTRLTSIYLDRIAHLNPKINCIITLPRDHPLPPAN